ncbi:MAG: Fe-S cluster assembly ATPase SufC, partial [Phycisphaeraceae bacterium]
MPEPLLEIKNLHASIDDQPILKGLDLTINPGEMHSIMGPNGSGKSTLAQVLAGHEAFDVTEGEIRFQGEDLLALEADERARAGVFLAFQYPVEIPGVSTMQFLKAALNAHRKQRGQEEIGAVEFLQLVKKKARLVELNQELLKRPVNEGFSGGEKKRH